MVKGSDDDDGDDDNDDEDHDNDHDDGNDSTHLAYRGESRTRTASKVRAR